MIREINYVSHINKVYDIEVENNSNYLTTSGIVHNSAAGCLVSYLLNITQVNPIENNLIFERFYNAGRNSPGHIQYPDIDTDFQASRRDEVIDYIRQTYGDDKVAQICTVGRMMGRGVVKDVFRIYDIATYDEVNRITDWIPDEAKIADELQHMVENGEKPSIVMWALKNHQKELKEWVELQDNKLVGKYAHIFAQAIRLEGTARSTGKHASGLVISPFPLGDFCPMLYDKRSSNPICGLELEDLEPYGLPKFDILGLSALDKINTALELIK
jgi:DNA polymerase-3 subunit alpha